MKNVKVEEIEGYEMKVKEITFTYNGKRFAIRKNTCPSYTESFVIDLNEGKNMLSDQELAMLKSDILENYEFEDFEVGDDFDIE